MKVIFIKDLKKQGKVNDIKEVSDGYAVNFLIKNGYAVKYTKTSSSRMEEEIKNKKETEEILRKEALAIAAKLEKVLLKFVVQSNNGKVFGSVSSKQIALELDKLGYKVDKKMIQLDGPLNCLGVHEVAVELYKNVIGKVRVQLLEK